MVWIVNIKKQDFTFGRSLNAGCEASNGDILFYLPCIRRLMNGYQTLLAPFEKEFVDTAMEDR